MNLRQRFALHAGMQAGKPAEAGGGLSEETAAPASAAAEATDQRFASHAGLQVETGEPAERAGEAAAPASAVAEAPAARASDLSEGTAVRASELSQGTAPRATPAPDMSRVRGEAYVQGVYRLFVRGKGPRPQLRGPQTASASMEHLAPAVTPAAVTLTRDLAPSRPLAPSPRPEPPRAAPPPVTTAPTRPSEQPPRPAPARPIADAPRQAAPTSATRTTEPTRTTSSPPANPAPRTEPPPTISSPPANPAPRTEPPPSPRPTALSQPPDPLALGPDRGGIVRRVVDWPLTPGARPALLGGALARLELPDAARWRTLVPRLLAGATPGESRSPVVFLDVETTALDRGAGALAFMVGLAAFVDGALRVEQWILTRLSSEAAMLTEVLARVRALAGPDAVLSSFNGASFDVPLLRTRLRRAGLSPAGLERPHLDLLPPSRRMWRGRGPDCRLITLERTQLGVRRVHDIAGHEIPAVFWAWLRRPDDPEVQAVMARVADHNLADLLTLPALGATLYACLTTPTDLDMAVRAAEHGLAAGRRAEALALLEAWHQRAAAPAQRRRALLLTADLLRRDAASRARAAELWAEVCRISPGDPAAHEALAKHLEHHAGDLARAMEVARGSATPCPRRLARLQRKLAAAATPTSATAPTAPTPDGPRSVPGPLRSGQLSC